MIKMVDVDKVPEKPSPLSEIVDAFIQSGKLHIKLDIEGDERPRQVIYQGIYNTIKNRELLVKLSQIDGEIYLSKIVSPTTTSETTDE